MENILHIRKTELARKTSQVIRRVQRGQTVLVENHGLVEAAILDILDYHILRAVTSHYYRTPKNILKGLSFKDLINITDLQEKYDLVLTCYLAGVISLGHAAELLELPALDLQARFNRMDVPILLGPKDKADAEAEVNAARNS